MDFAATVHASSKSSSSSQPACIKEGFVSGSIRMLSASWPAQIGDEREAEVAGMMPKKCGAIERYETVLTFRKRQIKLFGWQQSYIKYESGRGSDGFASSARQDRNSVRPMSPLRATSLGSFRKIHQARSERVYLLLTQQGLSVHTARSRHGGIYVFATHLGGHGSEPEIAASPTTFQENRATAFRPSIAHRSQRPV